MRTILSTFLFALVVTPVQIASAQSAAQAAKAPARKPATSAHAPVKATPAAAAPTPAPAQPCSCPPRVQHVQPYTAKQEITRVQTLTDGTKITTVEDINLARDAEGRTRRETIRTQNGDAVHTFQVFDYVAQTTYTWTVGANYSTIVNVFRQRPNPQPAATTPPPPPPQRYYPSHSESLPPQTIDGVYVEGNRNSRTTPAGYAGNDRDIVTTTESWFAPSLGMQIRLITDDPRTGKSTTETTDIKLSAPDPTLFQPPAGYTLRDTSPQ